MKATYISKDQNFQDETTIYWFDVEFSMYPEGSGTYGVFHNHEKGLLDCDGAPLNMSDPVPAAIFDACVITDEMIMDF